MQERSEAPRVTSSGDGRSPRGLSVSLLVRDVAAALEFQREVLGAEIGYVDRDFALNCRAIGLSFLQLEAFIGTQHFRGTATWNDRF